MPARWSIAAIVDAVAAGLRADAERLDAEQAVYGLDARDELALHPLLADSLAAAAFGVYREVRYPADRHRRRVSEGERCDLVITPDSRPLDAPDPPRTLFDPADAVALGDAFWLEVKVVAQFTTHGPNRRYSAQLLGQVRRDVAKLAKDRTIRHRGILIILFTADRRVADHDLLAWQTRASAAGLPIRRRTIRRIALGDRLGNTLATVAVFQVGRGDTAD